MVPAEGVLSGFQLRQARSAEGPRCDLRADLRRAVGQNNEFQSQPAGDKIMITLPVSLADRQGRCQGKGANKVFALCAGLVR